MLHLQITSRLVLYRIHLPFSDIVAWVVPEGAGLRRRYPFALNCCCTKVIKANFARIQSFSSFSISNALLISFGLFAVK